MGAAHDVAVDHALHAKVRERVDAIVKRPAPNKMGDLATGPSREDAESRMFKNLEPALRAWTIDRITPHPVAALEAPMVATTFWDQKLSASVIRCTQAVNPPRRISGARRRSSVARTTSSTRVTIRC
jgi:hypothetical protein